MLTRFRVYLGPIRTRALFMLLAATGVASLLMNAFESDGGDTRDTQSLLLLVFLVGAALIIGSRFERYARARLLTILGPALVAWIIGLFLSPDFFLPLVGASLGWIFAGLFVFRDRTREEYKQAVKYLRRSEYADAISVMDSLIKSEPGDEDHYRFRAEIFRVWGKLDRAIRDYHKMTQLAPDSAVAFNGLAEVYLQSEHYDKAREAALKAYELAPDEWVAAYNLGMIEDRLAQPDEAVTHLRRALELKVPDARHRLLIHLYLVRAFARLGDDAAASDEIETLKGLQHGLKEWQTIFSSEQSETLRAVLAADVEAAQALVDGRMEAADLLEQA